MQVWRAACSAYWLPGGRRPLPWWLFALLKVGDEVLIPDNAYGPTRPWPKGSCEAGDHHRYPIRWMRKTWQPNYPIALRWSGSQAAGSV